MHGSGLQVFTRYATEHRHSGLGRYTPAAVHVGAAALDQQRRQRALDRSWARHPEGSVKLFGVQQFSGAADHHTERCSGSEGQVGDLIPHLKSGG
jgi:hypothetical protein